MHKDKSYYQAKDKNVSMTGWAFMALGIVILMISIGIVIFTSNNIAKQDDIQTADLTSISEPSCLRVIATFDEEPVEIRLVDPSGKRYMENNLHHYEVTDNSIVCEINTDKTGEWTVEYNVMSNKNLQIRHEVTPPEHLFLTNVDIQSNIDEIIISMEPICNNDLNLEEVKGLIRMTLPNREKSVTIYDGPIAVNETVSITCNTENLISADNWNLSIVTYQEAGLSDDPYSCKYEETVAFTKSEPIPEEPVSERPSEEGE